MHLYLWIGQKSGRNVRAFLIKNILAEKVFSGINILCIVVNYLCCDKQSGIKLSGLCTIIIPEYIPEFVLPILPSFFSIGKNHLRSFIDFHIVGNNLLCTFKGSIFKLDNWQGEKVK